ncbi:MAG: HEAT repeat domain-containing protein [Deltaproteobacteria bacterium]|nr:HEAT repeat domain-containing protein [Deltaproteobacteria bacterium]
MERRQLERSKKRLENRWPLVGTWMRRSAVRQLAEDSSAEAVPLLVEALRDSDEQVRATADTALRNLKKRDAIDALCALWVTQRTAVLRAIIRERGYIASQPAKVRVLLSLLINRPATDAEAVPLLVEALADVDEQVRAAADTALRNLTERDAIDTLCYMAIREPRGVVATICIETGKRPSDHEDACLLLFVTRQLDAYFQEDFEFQELRRAYDRATDEVKAHAMEVVRTGDRRCQGFFGRRKPLSECTVSEIRLAIESMLRHRDWPHLFQALQKMPLKYGFPLLEEFRKSGWEPEQADQKSLYRAVLAESDGHGLPPPPPSAQEASSVFEHWLAEGRSGTWSHLDEGELLKRLPEATPPDGVQIVAALATKSALKGQAARVVQLSPHWLVRLAGYTTGLCWDLDQDEVKDSNHWVNEFAGATWVWGFWPTKATPGDLDTLNSAPREAFMGKYGAVRRVLQVLLADRVTDGTLIEEEPEADESAGVFEKAEM